MFERFLSYVRENKFTSLNIALIILFLVGGAIALALITTRTPAGPKVWEQIPDSSAQAEVTRNTNYYDLQITEDTTDIPADPAQGFLPLNLRPQLDNIIRK